MSAKNKAVSRIKFIVLAVVACGVGLYAISAVSYLGRCTPARASCLEHRNAGCLINGEYNVKVGNSTGEATCDMKTDGGGWTLVANYAHLGKPNDDAVATLLANGKFPIQATTKVGADERITKAWGLVSNSTLTTMPSKEFRFRCLTSAHGRTVDFALSEEKCVNYLKSGQGYCVDSAADSAAVARGSRGLANNSARLPSVADKGWRDQRDSAIVNYPFFQDYRSHWSVGSVQNRFECDDYEPGGSTKTLHQVWVR